MSARILGRAVVLSLAVAATVLAWLYLCGLVPTGGLPEGVSRSDYQEAARQFERVRGRKPTEADVFYQLSETAAARGDWKICLPSLHQITSSDPQYGHWARCMEGHLLLAQNRGADAAAVLLEFHRLEQAAPRLPSPMRQQALSELLSVLLVQLRMEERHELLRVICAGPQTAEPRHVLEYCFPSGFRTNDVELMRQAYAFLRADPGDFDTRVALGRHFVAQGRSDAARSLLEECVRQRADDRRAAAALLECLFEQSDWPRIDVVGAALPPAADDDPWLLSIVRGHWHNRRREPALAVACFKRVLALDPANVVCCRGLAEAYASLGENENRDEAIRRAGLLSRVQNRLSWISADSGNHEPYVEIAQLCAEARLLPQARLVATVAARLAPQNTQVQEFAAQLEAGTGGNADVE